MTTLEKVRRLEEYIAINNSVVDSVVEITINKLLARELERVSELKLRLTNDISEFENQYSLKSDDFYTQYEAGKLGDLTDFVEWAATIEMLINVNRQYELLETSGN
ncbi:MAG: hypothetical protein HQK64_09205 [Desulfamplus sp.]|nr:hypothetical protein [Desulfamplus sp.]